MAGVSEQGGGVADIAVDRLGHHQRDVERNADCERLAETGGRMDMDVAMTMIMAGMVMVVMTVMVVASHL
ncbi:hypothetical protein GCM10007858_24420 [Bradyrhizobium liaoningense]|nr:hypothetical protein GCM10007858_24420 [Bradyrhizobium liaoningense]